MNNTKKPIDTMTPTPPVRKKSWVWLCLCVWGLVANTQAAPPSQPSTRPSSQPSAAHPSPLLKTFQALRKSRVLQPLIQKIRKTGPGHYTLPHRLVVEMKQRREMMLSKALFLPHIVKGKVKGISITRIAPGSVYKHLGFQNKDVIKAVDGVAIRSIQDALHVFFLPKGKPSHKYPFLLERRGKTLTLTFVIKASPSQPKRLGITKHCPKKHICHFWLPRHIKTNWLSNPMGHAVSARIAPYYHRGRRTGIKLVWLQRRSWYRQLGLKQGDLLLAINENMLNDNRANGILQQLVEDNPFQVTFARKRQLLYHIYHTTTKRPDATMLKRAQQHKLHIIPWPPQPSSRSTTQRKAPSKSNRQALQAMISKITKSRPGEYTLPRGFVSLMTKNLALIASDAAIVPHFANGKPVGFRIKHIQKDAFYKRIGIQEGDILLAINKYPFTSPQKALEAYSQLLHAKVMKLKIQRKGKLLELRLIQQPKEQKPHKRK